MNVKPSLFFLSFLLVPLLASASFSATDTSRILAEQKDIRAESEQPQGKYSRFNDAARARLHRAQDVIFAILSEGKALEQLSKEQQVDLMNAVEEVKAVLADNEKDKLECWRERKTGTNMKVTMCETVAQREQIKRDAQAWKEKPFICVGVGECGAIK
jgi:peroxiredoxin family protein